MIKILIADDHAIVREGLKQIVAEEADILVAGEASNTQVLMDKLKEDEFDILILDTIAGKVVSMPSKI